MKSQLLQMVDKTNKCTLDKLSFEEIVYLNLKHWRESKLRKFDGWIEKVVK